MSQAINRYKCDLRDYQFLLFEQFQLQEILGKGRYADWGADEVTMVLSEVYKWSCDVLVPSMRLGTGKAVSSKMAM